MSNTKSNGTMKAIIEKGKTYEITGERGDFFITKDNRGKVGMFAKRDVEVVDIESMPKAKKYSKRSKNSTGSHARLQRDLAIALHDEHKF